MEITSVGFLSETLFQRYNGIVQDHGRYTEVRTPANLTFWFGNYLLLPAAPGVADIPAWINKFDATFEETPEVMHKCLQWPDDGREVRATRAEFERLGWAFDQASVLATKRSTPARIAPQSVKFREISAAREWAQVLEHQVLTRPENFAEDPYRVFKIKRLENFRELIANGYGHWYGAFQGDDLVADMGIFHRAGVSRFQEVSTHPAHRRQGICSALVHFVSCAEQQARPGNQMVILADAGEPAERIYKNVGYREIEQIQSVVLRPKGWDD